MSGISTTWYTWLEQGRDVSLSVEALARLAEALALDGAERRYLFELAQRRDPAPTISAAAQAAPADLLAVLDATHAAAYLLDGLWTVRGFNPAAQHLFAPWFETGELCLLRYLFLDPRASDFVLDWDDRARRLVAEFRADTARSLDNPALTELVLDLKRRSPVFARLWNRHAVLPREGGLRTFRHPQDGLLRYRQVTLVPATHPDHKLVMLLPAPGCDPHE